MHVVCPSRNDIRTVCIKKCVLLAAAGLCGLISLLLLAQYDADQISLMLLHVLHQLLFTCGLEATDTAAKEQHTVFHTWPCLPRAAPPRHSSTGLRPHGVALWPACSRSHLR